MRAGPFGGLIFDAFGFVLLEYLWVSLDLDRYRDLDLGRDLDPGFRLLHWVWKRSMKPVHLLEGGKFVAIGFELDGKEENARRFKWTLFQKFESKSFKVNLNFRRKVVFFGLRVLVFTAR